MLIDTDRLRVRIEELKRREELAKEQGTPMLSFITWARTAEAGRAVDVIEDFWAMECADIREAMERDRRIRTRVLRAFGMEELSRDACLVARSRFWAALRRFYEHFLLNARHVKAIIKNHFNWSRHP